jgi:hypothetical protein
MSAGRIDVRVEIYKLGYVHHIVDDFDSLAETVSLKTDPVVARQNSIQVKPLLKIGSFHRNRILGNRIRRF